MPMAIRRPRRWSGRIHEATTLDRGGRPWPQKSPSRPDDSRGSTNRACTPSRGFPTQQPRSAACGSDPPPLRRRGTAYATPAPTASPPSSSRCRGSSANWERRRARPATTASTSTSGRPIPAPPGCRSWYGSTAGRSMPEAGSTTSTTVPPSHGTGSSASRSTTASACRGSGTSANTSPNCPNRATSASSTRSQPLSGCRRTSPPSVVIRPG